MFNIFTLYGFSSAQAQKTPYEYYQHMKGLFVSQQAVCYLRDGRILSKLRMLTLSTPLRHMEGGVVV